MSICYIAGAWNTAGMQFTPQAGDCVIAADGGYAHLKDAGLSPDLVLGDFDSLGYVPQHPNLLRHPAEKDDTDMMLAVKTGLSRGYRQFVLYGGIGGRLDHTIANLQTLQYLSRRGAAGYLVGDGCVATAITDGAVSFSNRLSGMISVFCLAETAHGVSIRGLKYPLSGVDLQNDLTLGVSNEFLGKPACVSVEHGTLLLTWNDTAFCPADAFLQRNGGQPDADPRRNL